mmetsp:Transcript_23646/g.37745  ORF Transcript_23646/g.37745 Transcript_23646/m.37745 type:complete len:516 (+) Transcript_23646:471-2018(+)|eukprot:CAMPEP_0203745712 /NCGR_PEP_ID=MMETSP0098-20131031/1362_1 /ASSEMBLY_ACC=CAM_ASM_000208 /TAXON_ID=96639 /ORGANISM=" , Strain NY0313808BC1" /LENGTH=515 /DNA_ID=CAMNT_0050633569 /DNA_START=218 /DNA_END=1765 /DNA_ORIENTATION=+
MSDDEHAALLGDEHGRSLEVRRVREREDLERRKFVNICIKCLNLAVLVLVLVSLLFLYLKLIKVLSWNWFAVFSPVFAISSAMVLRGLLKISVLPPGHILALSVAQYGTRPMESNVRSILLTLAIFFTTVLLCVRLQGLASGMNALIISSPVLACLGAFVAYGVFNVFFRKPDNNLSTEDNRHRKSTMRMELVIFSLTLLTVVLAALRIQNVFKVSWFLVFAWPIILSCFWAIAALGLTCLIVGWILNTSRGQFQAMDEVLGETVGPNYVPDGAMRLKIIAIASMCVFVLDAVVVGVFVSLFHLIRVLSGVTSSLDAVFVPLILDVVFGICLVLSLEYFILPHLQVTQLSPDQATVPVNPANDFFNRQRMFSPDGKPIPIRDCVTCRQPVHRVVKIGQPNVHFLQPPRLESNPFETDEKEPSQILSNAPDCMVCAINQSDIIFLPCGHGGVCSTCAQQWVFGTPDSSDSTDNSKGAGALDALNTISPVQTPLFLVQQSRTFFKAVFAPSETTTSR